jgi:molecular chaperone GrpE
MSDDQVQKEEPETGEFQSAANPKQVTITDEELRNLQRETMDYKDKYLRLLADAENARKRLHKEKQEITRYAIDSIITEFLHPIDSLENALKFAKDMSADVKNWAFGFQMILSQFKDVLTANGVTPIESVGAHFDPHKHEAVEMVESDQHEPGIIIEELMKGYKIGDRTIRPARVKVVQLTQEQQEILEEQEQEENN